MTLFGSPGSGSSELHRRLQDGRILQTPGCFDALSARILERAGFEALFLSGFATSAARLALPDAGLISYGEMVDQGRDVCAAVTVPVFGDADTGYGNELNIERTLLGYAGAGFAGLMIEDQVWPKRCGHTPGKRTVDRSEALRRVRSAVRARDDAGLDLMLIARTDANATEGFDEALARCEAFAEAGAELTFLEAPRSEAEMQRYCESVPGRKMANLVRDGLTPWLAPEALEEIGYSLVAYPLVLLAAGVDAMEAAAGELRRGEPKAGASFARLQKIVGFDEYRRRVDDDGDEPSRD